MITSRKSPLVAPARWADLADELDRWQEEGRIATLWWRDDDAAAGSQRLDDLLTLAGEVPVALAVIPAQAEPTLAVRVEQAPPRVRVLQHGWRHADHSGGGKKSEFPGSRSCREVAADLGYGRARLATLFGARVLAALAPPWNRFDNSFLPLLAAAGITALTRVQPRPRPWPAPGVFGANVHVDLVDWRGDRGFVGKAAALTGIVAHLRARRGATADRDEPTGILTHHLVQDKATHGFLHRLLELTRSHPAARWLDAAEVFAPGLAQGSESGP